MDNCSPCNNLTYQFSNSCVCFQSFYNTVLRIVLFKEHPAKYLVVSFLMLFNIFVAFKKKKKIILKQKRGLFSPVAAFI